MIVCDENLHQRRLMEAIAYWYRGQVVSITALRPGTVIPDEAIPALLQQAKGATFITTNVKDFWQRAPAHERYCLICLPLPNERLEEVPGVLRRLLRLEPFRTQRGRLGKVILVGEREIRYYQVRSPKIRTLAWPR